MSKVLRKKRKFFIEVFYPKHDNKYLGRILNFKANGKEVEVFCTHFKRPDRHFYIKAQGYPLNDELLKKIKQAGINYVMIPEEAKNGFHCYLTELDNYFSESRLIAEENAEPQRVIPNRELGIVDNVDKTTLKRGLYF